MKIAIIIGSYFVLELSLHFLLSRLRTRFKNAIVTSKDILPKFNKEELDKYKSFDSELGWVRQPNETKKETSETRTTSYHIDKNGSRVNPNNKLPVKIETFGDSYVFGRQVNDDETWQYYLSKKLKCNITNYGVGNYGLDQVLLRFKREKLTRGAIVLIGLIPETIKRNLSVWKHYNEFGNTFAFKPRYKLENNSLVFVQNFIDSKDKFFKLKDYIKDINKEDYFYEEKFKKHLFKFPYLFSIFKSKRKIMMFFTYSGIMFLELFKIQWRKLSFRRNITRTLSFHLKDRIKYYNQKEPFDLILALLKEFSKVAKEKGLKPLLVMFPEYDDLDYIKTKGDVFYNKLLISASKFMQTFDITKELLASAENPSSLFANEEYGGHYTPKGNKIAAEALYGFLRKKKILE